MLDGTSVRIAFGVMALTFFALLCLMASGAERTTYVTWWRRSMLTMLLSFGLFLLDGTSLQRFTNPLGDLAIVAGAAMAWAGSRSLRTVRPALWQLAIGPALAFVCAVVDHPERSAWAEMRSFTVRLSASEISDTLTRLGRNRRRVRLIAWLTVLPLITPLPVSSQRRAIVLSCQ